MSVPKGLTRLQDRFVKSGFERFTDRQIIELALSLTLLPHECKQQAKFCIERFGSLRGLMAASIEELQQAGILPFCAICIRLLCELPAEILRQKVIAQAVYESSKEVVDYLRYSMSHLKKEIFKVIYLNNRNHILHMADLFEGTVDSIPIHPREIVQAAIGHNAAALIFVHNHPSGDPKPSRSDKQITRDLVFVGHMLQIKVLDHIIIGDDAYFSFADEGLIQKYEDSFLNLKIRGVLDSQTGYSTALRRRFVLHHN